MPTIDNLAAVAATISFGAGLVMMQRTLDAFERERIRLGIDSDEYAWSVLSAAAGSASSAVFFVSALMHAVEIKDSIRYVD